MEIDLNLNIRYIYVKRTQFMGKFIALEVRIVTINVSNSVVMYVYNAE